MIIQNPLTGIGDCRFESEYMPAQAEYLEKSGNSCEKMLAGNTVFCFNEFFRVLVESGVPGFITVTIVLLLVFTSKLTNSDSCLICVKSGIISLIVFGLFSYPGSVLPLETLFVFYLAVLASHHSPVSYQFSYGKRCFAKIRSQLKKGILIVSIAGLCCFPYQKISNLTKTTLNWRTARLMYLKGMKTEALEVMGSIYPDLNWDDRFLIMYASFLENAVNYHMAIQIYAEAARILPVSDVYIGLGNSYRALGNYEMAENSYRYVLLLVPTLARPVYELACLYYQAGKDNEALDEIDKFITKGFTKKGIATFDYIQKMKRLEEKIRK